MRTILFLTVLLAGCVPASRYKASQHRVAELDSRLATVEGALERLSRVVVIPATEADEEAAQALVARIRDDLSTGNQRQARARVEELVMQYPDTRSARSVGLLRARLSAIGRQATFPEDGWLHASGRALDLDRPTFVVSVAANCPSCPLVLAHAQEVAREIGEQAQVVAVAPSEHRELLASEQAQGAFGGLPLLLDDGSFRRAIGAASVPHAALIVRGRVTWVAENLEPYRTALLQVESQL